MSYSIGHLSLDGMANNIREQLIVQSSMPALLIDHGYYTSDYAYHRSVNGRFRILDLGDPKIPFDVSPERKPVSVASINLSKVYPDKPFGMIYEEASDYIRDFYMTTGYILTSIQHVRQDNTQEDSYGRKEDFLLICHGDKRAHTAFYTYCMEKDLITQEQLDSSNAILGILAEMTGPRSKKRIEHSRLDLAF